MERIFGFLRRVSQFLRTSEPEQHQPRRPWELPTPSEILRGYKEESLSNAGIRIKKIQIHRRTGAARAEISVRTAESKRKFNVLLKLHPQGYYEGHFQEAGNGRKFKIRLKQGRDNGHFAAGQLMNAVHPKMVSSDAFMQALRDNDVYLVPGSKNTKAHNFGVDTDRDYMRIMDSMDEKTHAVPPAGHFREALRLLLQIPQIVRKARRKMR